MFLQDGVWQNRRLLPEGWVAYTLTPAAAAPDAGYGAHMWLKFPDARDLGAPQRLLEPSLEVAPRAPDQGAGKPERRLHVVGGAAFDRRPAG